MSVLVWLLTLMMLRMAVMKSDEIVRVSANSRSSVKLPSGLHDNPHGYDIRWTQIPRLLLNKNRSTCSHRHCELLADGSLQFSHVQSQDSGNYTLEVFNERGQRHMTKHFLLQVKDSSSSNPVAASVSVCIVLLVLLLFFIVFFILRKRRSQRMPTTGHTEGNVYMVMKGYQGNEKTDEKKLEEEEEPLYVPCKPAGSSQHEEGVYV